MELILHIERWYAKKLENNVSQSDIKYVPHHLQLVCQLYLLNVTFVEIISLNIKITHRVK